MYSESSVANELNDFFTKILEQLRKDDYSDDSVLDDSKLKKFISSRLSPTTSFVIPEIKPQQVADIISKISVNKATGHDGVKTLKHLSTHFAGYWTYQLQPIPSLITGKSAKLHHCTKVVSIVKEITIALYHCCQSYLKSSKNM